MHHARNRSIAPSTIGLVGLVGLAAALAALPGCLPLGGGGDGGDDVDMKAGGDDAGGGVMPKFSSLYGDYLGNCKQCHTPSAPGRTSETEKTLDFTSAATAYTTLSTGKAMGLMGNHQGCNNMPFLTPGDPKKSLLFAVIDQPTRKAFDYPAIPDCDETAISDMTVKVGTPPSDAFVLALKDWITGGAKND